MRYVLGIDGGGTKTACALSDEQGNILGFSSGPASSYVAVGENKLKASLITVIGSLFDKMAARPKKIDIIYAGISGINKATPEAIKNRVTEELIRLTSVSKVIFDEDCDLGVAFAGSLESDKKLPGILVLAGTGIGIMGINLQGERKSLHGWGHLMGDEGSGYNIGIKVLMAAARAFDGRGKDTVLKELFLELPRFKNCIEVKSLANKDAISLTDEQKKKIWGDITSAVYHPVMEREEIASLSKYACMAAEKGDEIAIGILKSAGEELGCAINVAAKSLGLLGKKFQVIPACGVFKAGDFVIKSLKDAVLKYSPEAEILSPVFLPVLGAVILGLETLGKTIGEEVKNNLRTSARRWTD